MFLFVLVVCGLLVIGTYFLIYTLIEIAFILIIGYINSGAKRGSLLSSLKYMVELLVFRICGTIVWCIIFSIVNAIVSGEEDIYYQWFPPAEILFPMIYPRWHLILTLAICLILTLAFFQFSILKGKKFVYYMIILVTTLIMFFALTIGGLPLYFH